MKMYGARRLVIMNSGRYEYAEIDLSSPVHLAARNNTGKSTLVNALQFLYIDQRNAMQFGQRTHADSWRHYFSSSRAYIVFECATPTGDQCLLVRGMGAEHNCQFQRFVYEGRFDLDDFTQMTESGENVVVDFDTLRSRLAGRELLEVKANRLWEVLAAKATVNDKDLPRLSILPIKTRSEYTSFRDVYVRLLALSNASAKQLRQLLIKCYAREIGEKQIDVRNDYQEHFDRAERTEKEFNFISVAAELIDKAQLCHDKIEGLQVVLSNDFPEIVKALSGLKTENAMFAAMLETEKNKLASRRDELDEQLSEEDDNKESSREELTRRKVVLEELDSLHEKWGTTSPEMIETRRDGQKETATRIGRLQDALKSTKGLSRDVVERQFKRLEKEQESLKQLFDNWSESFGAYLIKQGVTRKQLDSAFRLINPDTLKMPVGDSINILRREEILDRIRVISKRFKNYVYSDDAIEAKLDGLDPAIEEIENRDLIVERLQQTQSALKRSLEEFQAIEQREKTEAELEKLNEEFERHAGELKQFDDFRQQWETRADLQASVEEQQCVCDKIDARIKKCRKELKNIEKKKNQVERDSSESTNIQRDIDKLLAELRGKTQAMADLWPLDSHDEGRTDGKHSLPRIRKRFARVVPQVNQLKKQLDEAMQLRQEQQGLAKDVELKSRGFEGQRVYFSEFDRQWSELFERRSKLDELQALAERQWGALFKPLAARLNDMLVAFQNVRNAVSNLNRRLGKHQVSNLKSLHVSVEEEKVPFTVVETLGSRESLFQDPDQVDLARRRLKNMIDDGQVIDLENLFYLKIEAEESNGNRIMSNSLDEIGSTGTGTTAKAMIFVNLVRAIATDKNYKMHFYIDEIGDLDDANLEAVTCMAVEQGILPITANPHVKLEPLAHPEVTNYALGMSNGRFIVDEGRTYRARKRKLTTVVNDKVVPNPEAARK